MVVPLVPPEVHTAGVVVVKLTVRPDEAVAVTANGDCASVCRPGVAKVMVWFVLLTAKLRVTGFAAL